MEGRREHLLSGIGGPSRFGDQTLIFWTPLMMMQFPSFFLLLFCFSFFSFITSPRTLYMFPIALIWRVFAAFWVCNYGVTLCYYFYYCYDIVLILRTPFFFFIAYS